MRKILIYFGLIFLAVVDIQSAERANWLTEINPSAKIVALGGGGVAVRDNYSAIVVNPAIIAYDPSGWLSLFYSGLTDKSHFGYMEFVYPFSWWGGLGGGAELRYKDSENHLKYYYFAFAGQIFKQLKAGVSAKAIMKEWKNDYGETIGVDAGLHITPFEWLNIGLVGENLNQPEINYEVLKTTEVFVRKLKAGICLFHLEYFNFVADLYIEDLENISFKGSYGIEIYPFSALALRGGIKDDSWRMGVGIISKNVSMDYAYRSGLNDNLHFIQFTYKFKVAPKRLEKELKKLEFSLSKDAFYLDAVRYFNKGEIAVAKEKMELYINDYKMDERMSVLKSDIDDWLNRMRKEKLGRAEELKKEILKDYYQGKIKEALVKLENAKLLAPNYDDLKYLEHLLNARVLLEEGKFNLAEKELIQALKINPDSKEVIKLHGRIMEVIKLSE